MGLQMKKHNLNVSFMLLHCEDAKLKEEESSSKQRVQRGGTWSLKKIIAFFLGEKCRLQIVLGLLGIAKNSSAPCLLQLFISTEMVMRRIFP